MACCRIFANANSLAVLRSSALCSRLYSSTPVDSKAVKVQSATSQGLESVEVRDDIAAVTHTGQVFEPTDYRNVRFTHATRWVNPNWGIELIDEVPPKEVTDRVIWCDGGDPLLGHPKVYINLDQPGNHTCGYCGLRFVKKEGHH